MKKYLLFDLDGTLTAPGESEVYKGIPRMLRRLQKNGMLLAVASGKPQVYVERILDHFNLRKYFAVVVGSELDGTRESRDEVVQEALRQLFGGGQARLGEVYMIGDRRFDVEGARALQVESVGVTYGYGSMEELKEARADYIVTSVEELEKFLMRGVRDGQEPAGSRKELAYRQIWGIFFSLALFLAVRIAVSYIAERLGYQGVGVSGLGFLAGGLAIGFHARDMIERTREETRLNHLKKKRPLDYMLLALATVGAALGLNLLLELTRVTASSQSFQEVAESQYAVPFWLGLIVYGLVSPLAEELLFRGIIHNRLRRFLSPGVALVLSSALFAFYHGNLVQRLYGFLMGCLIAYAYEYFGDFKMAVAVHAGANALVFGLTYTGEVSAGPASWGVCAVLLALAAASLWQMSRRKRVL